MGSIFRLHLGVSLSSKAPKTLRTPYIDMDGNEMALGFIPYTNLNHSSTGRSPPTASGLIIFGTTLFSTRKSRAT